MVIPLFIVVAIELAYRSEAKWANKFIRFSSWLLAFGLAGFDVFKNFIGLELKPEIFANVLRYVSIEPTIPIITIIINIFVLLVGIGIWVRTKNWRWLFIGSLISLIGNALPSAQVGTLPGSASECCLAISLLLTQYNFEDELEESETDSEDIEIPEGWHQTEYSGYTIFWKEETNYFIYQTGSHRDGDFVRIYAPKQPYENNGKLKVITYLHGFSLCLPQFYEKHLEKLANEGFYVFFPDYQKSNYPNFPKDNESSLDQITSEKTTLKYWAINDVLLLMQLILGRRVKKREGKQLTREGKFKALRLSLTISLLLLIAKVISWFNKEYAKNLTSMIITVLYSLVDKPIEWLGFAVDTTATGWEKLCEHRKQSQNLDLSAKEMDFYVFGHSLGGLLALSWTYYLQQYPDPKLEKFYPQQIITGDPAPSTALGIPKIALWILALFRFPFATQPLQIKKTGKELNIPVGILHGNDDKLVKPTEWVKPPRTQQKGAFFDIVSTQKNIYFSLSGDHKDDKDLTANHNQSVTNTTYYGNGFMSNFGGVKHDPNAYNYEYIWPALKAIVKDEARADELSNKHGFELHSFDVVDEPLR
ncbi:MAG: hypothetical protein F6K62_14680 [Sphaerospermopsis sp. SIO1G2]|nr:hypothetical protein [Sphaerospermopsis sp. SIO1G2]